MSTIKLPPLPTELESVYVAVDGLSTYREARDCYYTMDQMRAYAEEAVRQALAAQSSDPRREAFEGWAAASKRRGNFKLRDGEGYADGYANSDWHVWKACVAALATQKQGDSDA